MWNQNVGSTSLVCTRIPQVTVVYTSGLAPSVCGLSLLFSSSFPIPCDSCALHVLRRHAKCIKSHIIQV
uniref:Uncharacterized protein n=1 Tax=Rhizophora mucronata TaxID=61149 RepID=A0A2P2NYD5_RHIMU